MDNLSQEPKIQKNYSNRHSSETIQGKFWILPLPIDIYWCPHANLWVKILNIHHITIFDILKTALKWASKWLIKWVNHKGPLSATLHQKNCPMVHSLNRSRVFLVLFHWNGTLLSMEGMVEQPWSREALGFVNCTDSQPSYWLKMVMCFSEIKQSQIWKTYPNPTNGSRGPMPPWPPDLEAPVIQFGGPAYNLRDKQWILGPFF